MASYKGHLAFASVLGAGYAALTAPYWKPDWGPVFLGAGLTALGGLLPDLDSDSGVPVRELFGLAAVMAPFLLFRRLEASGFSVEQTLVLLAAVYLLIRYCIASVFRLVTIHSVM